MSARTSPIGYPESKPVLNLLKEGEAASHVKRGFLRGGQKRI
ncbi:MAG TPA: hypothetical protein QF468_00455 [Nitrospinota bacterium]|nr:hypothetical protein [Nitrospinota bacterium]